MQTQAPPTSRRSSGTPRPTAIITMTSGDRKSAGGEPEPISSVLEGWGLGGGGIIKRERGEDGWKE